MPAAKLRRSLLPIPSSAALAAKREDAKLKGTAGGPPKSDAPIDIVATVQKENGKTCTCGDAKQLPAASVVDAVEDGK